MSQRACGFLPALTVSAHAQLPKQVTAGLSQHGIDALQKAVRPRAGARRDIDRPNAFVLEQPLDAEHVIGIADSDAAVQSIGAHDHGHAYRRLGSIGTLSFCNQVPLWNPTALQVVASDSALAEAGIGRSPTGCDDDGGNVLLKKVERVIEPRPPYG